MTGQGSDIRDWLVFGPADVDLAHSPLRRSLDVPTFVLGAFNPGMTRLANGNLLLMVRIAEALAEPIRDGHIHAIRWTAAGFVLDRWPLDGVDAGDPRMFRFTDQPWRPLGLTSLSWLLPVELTPDGREVLTIHYDRAIVPAATYQDSGVEDARISHVGDRWLMTVCSVSAERLGTSLYTSNDGLDWTLEGLILDHQNKDMLIFEGLIGGYHWAQTRPLGETWFAYSPESEYRAGPSINLASSPDALHWRPRSEPGIRPHSATVSTARMGGGTPPVLTADGWLTLWHGVAPGGDVGIYRTYWSILDAAEPWRVVRTDHAALLEPMPGLPPSLSDRAYLSHVVFTTGIADAGEHWLVSSGEADLACRMSLIPKARFA